MSTMGSMNYFPFQQDATRFAQDRFPQLQPAQNHQIVAYNGQSSSYLIVQMTPMERQSLQKKEQDLQRRADMHGKRLTAFLSREKGAKANNTIGPHLPPLVTWEDVLQEIEDSKAKWENKADGNLIRQETRTFGDRARVANHWLDLLPAGDYGSVVCGGLKLLFGAAIAEADYRDLIFDCMDTLPALIEEVGEILDTYQEQFKFDPKQNYRLLNGSLALSTEILNIAELITDKFELSGWRKSKHRISAFFKQGEHTANLQGKLKSLEKRAEELRRIANQLQQKVTKETNDRVKQLPTRKDIREDMAQFLVEEVRNAEYSSANQRLAAQTWQSRPITPIQINYLPKEQIFKFLQIDPIPIVDAMHRGLDSVYHDTRNNSVILRSLQRDISFLNWLRSNQSAIVMLDVDSYDGFDTSTAPFSYFAAALVESLKNFHQAIAIHYFCPVWDPDNPKPGNFHMLRSLIFQLLPYIANPEVSPEDIYSDVEKAQRLCNLFKQCMDHIPAGTTIFVVIDGISKHSAEDEAEALFVTRFLIEALPRYRHMNKRVKVMLTAPINLEIAEMVGYESSVKVNLEGEERGDSDEDIDADFGGLVEGNAEED